MCASATPGAGGDVMSFDSNDLITVAVGAFIAWQLKGMFFGKVAPQKAKALVAAGARLVDVRTPGEYAGRHLERSVNLPLSELGARLSELGDKAKPIVVYCASGVRSASAKRTLKSAGFTQVFDLGSIGRWAA